MQNFLLNNTLPLGQVNQCLLPLTLFFLVECDSLTNSLSESQSSLLVLDVLEMLSIDDSLGILLPSVMNLIIIHKLLAVDSCIKSHVIYLLSKLRSLDNGRVILNEGFFKL